jgi:hypothetical protein
MKTLSEISKEYLHVREIGGNNISFNDQDFERDMKLIGWRSGWAYCVFFGKLCTFRFVSKYDSTQIRELMSCFKPLVIVTFRNFQKIGLASFEPTKNSLAVWQNFKDGKGQSTGHLGVVVHYDKKKIRTIDGNTNIKGSREGDGVFDRTRTVNWVAENGLRLIGFINLPEL